jgi:hypothetical protein
MSSEPVDLRAENDEHAQHADARRGEASVSADGTVLGFA